MEKKLCALTFDDGPNTDTTPLVLEKLKKHGVIASFFLVGDVSLFEIPLYLQERLQQWRTSPFGGETG